MDEFEAILETGGAAAVEVAASAVAARGGKTMSCPNCSKPMIGPYCALCGQPLNTHRRSLGHLLKELFKDVASFDSRILRTAKALMVQPGELPKAFREGRTQRYVPSVRLYFFVSLLFFLFLSFSSIAILQLNLDTTSYRLTHDAVGNVFKEQKGKRILIPGVKADTEGSLTLDVKSKVRSDNDDDDDNRHWVSLSEKADGVVRNDLDPHVAFFQRSSHTKPANTAALDKAISDVKINTKVDGNSAEWVKHGLISTLEKLREDPAALNEPLTTWIPRILFVLLPLFALLLAFFYRRQRQHFYFVDHLVFSFTMHSFTFVVLIGAALLAQVLAGHWVARLTIVVLALYFFLSLKVFYGQGWLKTGLKFAFIAFIYGVFFLAPALTFALIACVFGA